MCILILISIKQYKKLVKKTDFFRKNHKTGLKIRISKNSNYKIKMTSQVQLYPHQISVVNHMKTHRGCIAIHETGTGKTITAVASIKACQALDSTLRVIIVTPTSISSQFAKEVHKWECKNVSFFTPRSFMSMMENNTNKVDIKDVFLIVDEVHNLRTKVKVNHSEESVYGGKQAYFIMKCAEVAKKVLLLTATPVINNPFDIYNYVMMIDGIKPEESINEARFNYLLDNENIEQMFGCKISYYAKPVAEPGELSDFPERIHKPVTQLVMDEEYFKSYKAIETNQITQDVLDNLKSNSNGSDMYFTLLRQAINALDGINSPKIKWIKKFLYAHPNERTVIFSNWKNAGINLIEEVCDQLNIKYSKITGDDSEQDRDKACTMYNSCETNTFLISKAGMEGLDLKGTKHVILLESNWNSAADEQIIGRAIRCNSHKHLPIEERKVFIHRLMLIKPNQEIPDLFKSVDEELYRIAYIKKEPKIKEFLKRMLACNISNEDHICKCMNKNKNQISNICGKNNLFKRQISVQEKNNIVLNGNRNCFSGFSSMKEFISKKETQNDYKLDKKINKAFINSLQF